LLNTPSLLHKQTCRTQAYMTHLAERIEWIFLLPIRHEDVLIT